MTRIEQPHHSIRWRRGEPPSSGETPSRPGARSSSGAQRGCVPAAAVSVLYCVTRHTPGTPSTLYTTTLPAAASWLSCVASSRPFRARRLRRGPGRCPSIAGPIGPGSANRPSCPFARVSSRCSYNTTNLHTHSVAARPRAPRRRRRTMRDATDARPRGVRVGVLRTGASPRAVGTAPDRPHALWCLRPPPHEPHLGGRRVVDGVGRWGPARAVPRPRRTIVDRIVVRVAGAAQPALGRRQTRRHARR
jgi:hypothetical protein